MVQSVSTKCVSKIIRIVKSITGRSLYQRYLGIKTKLWGGIFWTSRY
ncbi:hypothetical protein ISS22_10130 [candidate division KSB1 bacterium]|nr:hypothetical protein [candidate division KSB1 bacterium]